MEPDSVKITGNARRLAVVDEVLYTSVFPKFLSPEGSASWVTVTVLVGPPNATIVTVAVLGLEPELAEVAVTVIEPLLEPLVGDTVSHAASSVILHVVFEEMSNVLLAPEL
jgi:hypothetical protein